MATIPKLATVKSVQASGTFNGNYGLLYKFEYVFSDDVVMSANHKSETAYFKEGTLVEYQIKQTNSYGNSGTVSKPKEVLQNAPQAPTNGFKSPDVQDMIIRQSSVKAAIDYKVSCGSNMSLEEMLDTAEVIFNYCKTGAVMKVKEKTPF